MFRVILFAIFIAIFFNSCGNDKKEQLKIVTSNWIGYTPLIYAKEKGLLQKLNIDIVKVVSLSETMYTYNSNHANIFAGTQFEFIKSLEQNSKIVPFLLLNKSDGGDVVMSNFDIETLQTKDYIDVYMEIDSINSIVFEDFIKKYNLKDKNFNYINKDQSYISELKKFDKPTIIISYNPYNIILNKNGLITLETTKDNNDILIIDALFTSSEILIKYKEELNELKKIIDLAIIELNNDPKKYYDTIKDYLYDTSYEEFKNSLSHIKWINNPNKELLENLKQHNFPIKELL